MSTANQAVFLSYASQDAEAARRIAEALRGFGVEVWFDQNELRGGDQWDNNIRSQIKACSLFIPIISQTTQSRDEAYFRLEWKLADDRSHLMAPGKAFIVPVVIDDTPDYGASVPDSFTKAQWTRLPGGAPSTAFIDQIKRLTQPKVASPVGASLDDARVPPASNGRGQATPLPGPAKKRRPALTYGAATAILIGVVTAVLVNQSSDSSAKASAEADALAQADTTETTAPAKSIAVLPFENRSANADDAFFSDGIHDDLLTHISRIGDIKTISRTSVMTYRDTTKNMRVIGEELGVAYLLEGGVQRAGDRVRINVQLIDAATDEHLWAEIYTRAMSAENLFEIQSEIATAITTALQAVISPAETQHLAKMPTENLEALEAYYRAHAQASEATAESFERAIDHFERAISLDPDFSAAYAQQAKAHLFLNYFSGLPAQEQVDKAMPLINRALELDPESDTAYSALAIAFKLQGEPGAAEAAFQRAIALNPNNAQAKVDYANLLLYGPDPDRFDQALDLAEQATNLDPLNVSARQHVAMALDFMGRDEDAEQQFRRNQKHDPRYSGSSSGIANLMASARNQYDEAIKWKRLAHSLDPSLPALARDLGEFHGALGLTDSAVFWFERALALAPESDSAGWGKLMIARENGDLVAARTIAEEIIRDLPHHWTAGAATGFLSGLDFENDRFQEARERIEANVPDFIGATTVPDGANPSLAGDYTIALRRTGEPEPAARWKDEILRRIADRPRLGRYGIGLLDVRLHCEWGNRDQAMAGLRDWRQAGGRADLSLTEPAIFEFLKNDPEFMAIHNEMLAELAEQRANVERWEAAGELAPIPPLPDSI